MSIRTEPWPAGVPCWADLTVPDVDAAKALYAEVDAVHSGRHIAVDDADTVAAEVAEHGGTVLLSPGDVGPMGRMFTAADPTGAAFGGWEAKENIGAGIVNEPGGLSWEDLRSPDPDTARTVYTAQPGRAD